MKNNTNGLEIDPSVLDQRTKQNQKESVTDKYDLDLFEEEVEIKDYSEYQDTVFLREYSKSDKKEYLFTNSIIYEQEKQDNQVYNFIFNIFIIIVFLEVIYIVLKLFLKRRKNAQSNNKSNEQNI